MNVYPLIEEDFEEQAVLMSHSNYNYQSVEMQGYVTEDGCIFYCENAPLFHPVTGEVLRHTNQERNNNHETR